MKGFVLASLISGVVVVLAAACGGGESVKADFTIDIKAENMRFVPDRIEVPAGKTVMIRMQNMDENLHDFEVGGLTAEIMGRTGMNDESMDMTMSHGNMQGTINMHSAAKGKASVTFRADKPGTYGIYCTMPGHKDSGMAGKLVVTAPASTKPEPKSDAQPVSSSPSAAPASVPPISLGGGSHDAH